MSFYNENNTSEDQKIKWLILTLGMKFYSFQAKLNTTLRSGAIENKFITNYTKLNDSFSSSKEEKYKTGLNEQREQMLEQLRAQRDHELNQVNELKASPELNQQQLTDLAKSLKSTQMVWLWMWLIKIVGTGHIAIYFYL
jgi:small-conductance mechanosensitive channel